MVERQSSSWTTGLQESWTWPKTYLTAHQIDQSHFTVCEMSLSENSGPENPKPIQLEWKFTSARDETKVINFVPYDSQQGSLLLSTGIKPERTMFSGIFLDLWWPRANLGCCILYLGFSRGGWLTPEGLLKAGSMKRVWRGDRYSWQNGGSGSGYRRSGAIGWWGWDRGIY